MLALLFASPAGAQQTNSPLDPCGGQSVTAKQFRPFSAKVWQLERWRRGWPKASTIAAYQHKLLCAAGPKHRQAMGNRWSRDRGRYDRYRHRQRYCRSGTEVRGRVSVFGGGLTASGHYTSEPGIALNIAPGTDAGWNNSTTRAWLSRLQRFRVNIEGHVAVLPVIDLGPAGWVGRAIDVTEGGAPELGLSVGAFPTDAIGVAKLIPPGCSPELA